MIDAAERIYTRLDMLVPGSGTGSVAEDGSCIEEQIGPAKNADWDVEVREELMVTRDVLLLLRA
jgi:hypothetical protein